LSSKKEYTKQRHFYSDFEKNERRERRAKRNRKSNTSSVRNLALNKIAGYFEEKVLPDYRREEFRWMLKIQDSWSDICGPLLVRYLRPHSFQSTKLVIEASSGLFLEQARLIEKQFLQRVQEMIPEARINQFEFKVGDFESYSIPINRNDYQALKHQRAQRLRNEGL
tara:strand:+ start:565 stop:1065 length:501 start_codon:yes stop_codon:yes gene_type:complete